MLSYCAHERYNEDPYIQLQNEDLLITKDGTIGKLAVVTNLDKPACLNSGIFVVRSIKDDFSTRFLLWVLKSSIFTDFNGLTAYGSTIQHLYQNVFFEFAFAFPPVNTQISIADYLQKKTAEIDHIIANKQKLIALYAEEKQGNFFKQVVNKGLDPNFENERFGGGMDREIPEHWEQKNLKYLARVQTGGTPKIQNAKMDYFADSTINWYTPSDFYNDGVLEDSNRKINEFAVDDNEVEIFPENSVYLVSIGATLGKVGLSKTKASANQQINVIIFDKSLLNPFYGYYFLVSNKEMIKLEADYTTLPILNQTKTKSLTIAYPNLKEQDEIVQYIDKECVRINTILEKFNKQIDLLKEYRTTLISEVVTGKIKVPNTIEA